MFPCSRRQQVTKALPARRSWLHGGVLQLVTLHGELFISIHLRAHPLLLPPKLGRATDVSEKRGLGALLELLAIIFSRP